MVKWNIKCKKNIYESDYLLEYKYILNEIILKYKYLLSEKEENVITKI